MGLNARRPMGACRARPLAPSAKRRVGLRRTQSYLAALRAAFADLTLSYVICQVTDLHGGRVVLQVNEEIE
jgi:hypothetical protein